LLINLFFEMQHSINGGFVWNTGKWPFVPATILSGILNLLFGFIGCYFWSFTGLAIGTMLAKLFTLNWFVVFYTLRRLGITIKIYLIEFLIPAISIILIIIPISYFTNLVLLKYKLNITFRHLPGNITFSLIVGSIITIILWLYLFYRFVFKISEKEFIKTLLNKFIHARRY